MISLSDGIDRCIDSNVILMDENSVLCQKSARLKLLTLYLVCMAIPGEVSFGFQYSSCEMLLIVMNRKVKWSPYMIFGGGGGGGGLSHHLIKVT